MNFKALGLVLCGTLLLGQIAAHASPVSLTTTSLDGVTIKTTVDSALNTLRYDWNFTALADDYEQIALNQFSAVSSAFVTATYGWVGVTQVTPYGATGIYPYESQVQIQFQGGTAPPRVNYILFTFTSAYVVTGNFADGPGSNNVVVSFRNGLPELTLSAYTPEIRAASAVPLPPSAMLLLSGLFGLGFLRRKSLRNS